MTIYLISSDGHRDSINLESYATDEEEVEILIKEDRATYGYEVANVRVLLKEEIVTFDERWPNPDPNNRDDDEWEETSYRLCTIERTI